MIDGKEARVFLSVKGRSGQTIVINEGKVGEHATRSIDDSRATPSTVMKV